MAYASAEMIAANPDDGYTLDPGIQRSTKAAQAAYYESAGSGSSTDLAFRTQYEAENWSPQQLANIKNTQANYQLGQAGLVPTEKGWINPATGEVYAQTTQQAKESGLLKQVELFNQAQEAQRERTAADALMQSSIAQPKDVPLSDLRKEADVADLYRLGIGLGLGVAAPSGMMSAISGGSEFRKLRAKQVEAGAIGTDVSYPKGVGSPVYSENFDNAIKSVSAGLNVDYFAPQRGNVSISSGITPVGSSAYGIMVEGGNVAKPQVDDQGNLVGFAIQKMTDILNTGNLNAASMPVIVGNAMPETYRRDLSPLAPQSGYAGVILPASVTRAPAPYAANMWLGLTNPVESTEPTLEERILYSPSALSQTQSNFLGILPITSYASNMPGITASDILGARQANEAKLQTSMFESAKKRYYENGDIFGQIGAAGSEALINTYFMGETQVKQASLYLKQSLTADVQRSQYEKGLQVNSPFREVPSSFQATMSLPATFWAFGALSGGIGVVGTKAGGLLGASQAQSAAATSNIMRVGFVGLMGYEGGKVKDSEGKDIGYSFPAAVSSGLVYGGAFETLGEVGKIKATAFSTGYIQPKVNLVAGKPLGVGGIVKETPTRLTMGTKNVGSGVAVEINAQQGLFSSTNKAVVPNDFIAFTAKDPSYARIINSLKPETQFTYPRSITTPFYIEISTPLGGKMKVPGQVIETQISTSVKLQPFENSINVGRGGVEPIGKSKVVSIKEYYLDGQKVGARTNLDTYYTGLADEVKIAGGKGYELPTYKQTSPGSFELLPNGKMITAKPSASFSGNIKIGGKSSAKGFLQESTSFTGTTEVSGVNLGKNTLIDVNGNKFSYPSQTILGEKGTIEGFRVTGKMGNAPMDILVIAGRPPTPKITPKNIGDIPTISFNEPVINPKKSLEYLGAKVMPTPNLGDRVLTYKDMGGMSVGQPKVIQLQTEMPTQIFKEAPSRQANIFSTMQPEAKLSDLTMAKPYQSSIQLAALFQMPSQTTKAYQPGINIEKGYPPATQIFKTYQPPININKIFQPSEQIFKTYQPGIEIGKTYQPPEQIFKVYQPLTQPERTLQPETTPTPERVLNPPPNPSIFTPQPPPKITLPPPEIITGGGLWLPEFGGASGGIELFGGVRSPKKRYTPDLTAAFFGIKVRGKAPAYNTTGIQPIYISGKPNQLIRNATPQRKAYKPKISFKQPIYKQPKMPKFNLNIQPQKKRSLNINFNRLFKTRRRKR